MLGLALAAWISLPDMPTPRSAAGVAVWDGKIAAAGGMQDGPADELDRAVDAFEAYDPAAGAWRKLPPLPKAVESPGLAAAGGTLYAVGGHVYPGRFTADVFAFDAKKAAWVRRAPLPRAASGAAAAWNGRIIFISAQSTDVFAYDPSSDRWERRASRPSQGFHRGSAAAQLGGLIYLAVGARPGVCVNELQVYDPAADLWSNLSPAPPAARCWGALAAAGGRLYLMGGSTTSGEKLSSVERYIPAQKRWEHWATLPEPRQDIGAALLNGTLYAVGGWDGTPTSASLAAAVDGPSSAASEPVAPPVPAMAAPRRKPRPDDYALVIGLDRYRALPRADFGQRDAAAFRDFAVSSLGVPEENAILLSGEDATRTDIAKYLEDWLPRNVTEDSRVYVFFSGHGAPDPETGEAYLVPWDGDPRFLATTAYSLKRFYEKLEQLRAREVIVALDSCFSGAGGRSLLPAGTRPLVAVKAERPARISVLTASAGDEITGSLEEREHGLFTYHLLEGLRGLADSDEDGQLRLKELHGFVRSRVARDARRQNRDQTPQLFTPNPALRLY